MKFKRLLIIGVAVLSLSSIGSVSGLAHADPTQAEKNASLAVDNALTKKYGDHVPTSASINAENDLDREFEGSSNGSSSSSGSTPQANTSSNNQQVHNSQPSTSNKSVNDTSNNNKSNSNINNKTKNKNSRHKNKNTKASNKKHSHKSKDHKAKSVTKARGSKNHEHKTNHHFLGIGIAVVVILAILGLCIKLFGHKNKH